jgi:hypothetical protein
MMNQIKTICSTALIVSLVFGMALFTACDKDIKYNDTTLVRPCDNVLTVAPAWMANVNAHKVLKEINAPSNGAISLLEVIKHPMFVKMESSTMF